MGDNIDRAISNWMNFEAEHLSCASLLADAGRDAFVAGTTDWRIPSGRSPEMLSPAIGAGLISVADGPHISFCFPEVQYAVLASYLVKEQLIPVWDDRERFTEILRQIALTKCVPRSLTLTAYALVTLHNWHNKDVIQRIAEGTEGGTQFPPLYHELGEVLPELVIDVSSLVPALADIQKATKNDMTNGMIYNAVQELCRRQPDVAEALFSILSSDPAAPVAAFLPNVLVGHATNDFASVHSRCLFLSASDDPMLARYAIVALGHLDYSDHQEALAQTLHRLGEVATSQFDLIVSALTNAYGSLLHRSHDESTTALRLLSASPDPEANHQLASVLFRESEECANEEWFAACLLSLSKVDVQRGGTLRLIDFSVSGVFQGNPELSCSFLETWALHNAESVESDLFSVFPSTFSTFVNNHFSFLEVCITRWFSSDHQALHRLAADSIKHVVQYRRQQPQKEIRLSKAELDRMSVEDITFAIHKILGYVLDAEALCTLIFSILCRTPLENTIVNNVCVVFEQFIGYNYPGTVKTYLEQQIRDGHATEKQVAQHALDGMERYYAPLRNRTPLKEFVPPTTRFREFCKAHSESIQKGMEAARESSPLLSLAKRIPLKGGKSWFSDRDGTLSEPSFLNQFSHEFEYLRAAIIDPIGFEHNRLMWRIEQRKPEA